MNADRLQLSGYRALPLWGAVLPLLTINVCYLVAMGLDHLPACVPYISGCASVSSTGRQIPESLIFRAGMLPSAAIVLLIWWRFATFLVIGGQSPYRVVTVRLLAVVAALSLVLYTLTLGFPGGEYRLLRRIGIDGFAVSNFIAQVLFIVFYRQMSLGADKKLLRWLVVVCVAMPALAIAAGVAKSAGAPRHATNNIAAWNAFILLSAYYFLLYRPWRRHGSFTSI